VAPCDLEQIRNTKKIIRNNARLSRDALYKMHEFACEYSNFIHWILTFPDLSVICYNPAMMTDLDDDALKCNKLSYHKQVGWGRALYHITAQQSDMTNTTAGKTVLIFNIRTSELYPSHPQVISAISVRILHVGTSAHLHFTPALTDAIMDFHDKWILLPMLFLSAGQWANHVTNCTW